MAPNLVQWDRILPYYTGGGLWGPFWVAKQVRTRLLMGPSLLLWVLKSLGNCPKWLKMATKGPNQYSMVILCPTVPELGPFKSFLEAKWVRNILQTGPSLLLWALKSIPNGLKWPKMVPKGPH